MRYVFRVLLVAAAASIAFATADRLALAQTVLPAPQPQLLPPATTSTACMVNCDTNAMNCQSACVVVGPVTTTTTTTSFSSCNLSCTTIQLVCKQGCTR